MLFIVWQPKFYLPRISAIFTIAITKKHFLILIVLFQYLEPVLYLYLDGKISLCTNNEMKWHYSKHNNLIILYYRLLSVLITCRAMLIKRINWGYEETSCLYTTYFYTFIYFFPIFSIQFKAWWQHNQDNTSIHLCKWHEYILLINICTIVFYLSRIHSNNIWFLDVNGIRI